MGCGGSKATQTKPAPVPVPEQIQSPAQTDSSSTQQRQQPEGITDGREETQEKEEDLEGPITQKQITLVQDTWKLVNGDLEQVGVEFYIR